MLYVLRHGQTDSNAAGKTRGSGDDSGLNKVGKGQAYAAREKIKDIKFDACYCSPMLRTRQTCKIAYRGQPCIAEGLRAMNYGSLTGKDNKIIEYPDFWKRDNKYKIEGGESLLGFETRVFKFMKNIAENHKGENVLLVTHGSVLKMIHAFFNGLPSDGDYENYGGAFTGEVVVYGL
jgi:probable phosphoglycerate mutase